MKTRDFLKNYAYIYFYIFSFTIVFGFFIKKSSLSVNTFQDFTQRPILVIDAGHGGIDGGTTSCTGITESIFNLQIAKRLDKLMKIMGYHTVMTRTDDVSLATEGRTIREQKRSDLQNRIQLVNNTSRSLLLSIHQNYFPDGKYYGPQVFFNHITPSREIAERLQTDLGHHLTPECQRQCKQADHVYLMDHIDSPGILIECGFLSNSQEEALLKEKEYQNKICCIIAASIAEYIETSAVR